MMVAFDKSPKFTTGSNSDEAWRFSIGYNPNIRSIAAILASTATI
ncbi:MAG: hypothetical protein WAZ77_13170 [Candidatus Nitrosopolaris sp.]